MVAIAVSLSDSFKSVFREFDRGRLFSPIGLVVEHELALSDSFFVCCSRSFLRAFFSIRFSLFLCLSIEAWDMIEDDEDAERDTLRLLWLREGSSVSASVTLPAGIGAASITGVITASVSEIVGMAAFAAP